MNTPRARRSAHEGPNRDIRVATAHEAPSATARATAHSPAKRLLRLAPVIVILAGLALGYTLGLDDYLSLHALIGRREALADWVALHRSEAALAFVAIYTTAVAFSFPAASVLTVVGGFLFGWIFGGILTLVAATLGATLVFLAARFALRDLLRRRAGPWLSRFSAGFERNAFGYLLSLRLAPIFPFFIVNVAPAFFEIGLSTYVGATAIGILPGTFAYAYLGAGLDGAIAAAARAGHEATLTNLVTPALSVAFLLLAVVAFIPTLLQSLRRRK